jgi:Cdc6-like AAA superfamily ATPase
MVKLHELILTFDTNRPNEQIEAQAVTLLDEINKLLSKHFKDTLPQVYKDAKKKSKISIVLIAPEDLDE